ncbi:uncharacterized protein V1518DRAFT_410216 [Limtongia smithiae]|uniref:uncharacterized protein n=1 Tax=Limtongia smithiae TaxID=1125753 RepID=UPI0034CF2F13
MPSSVAIDLDRRHGDTFTNLDIVRGQVNLRLQSEETIVTIQIKMEGITESMVQVTTADAKRERTSRGVARETHKILYLVNTVFPPEDIQNVNGAKISTKGYTLKPGQYFYPFEFRIPMNTMCQKPTGIIASLREDTSSYTTHHIVETLPPSLSDLETASIKYFFKVTVRKASFLKVNMRETRLFVFLPIEPPRPEQYQVYFSRRKHTFNYVPVVTSRSASGSTRAPQKNHGFFSSLRRLGSSMDGGISNSRNSKWSILRQTGPQFYFEARFREPRLAVISEVLPLRLFITTSSPNSFTSPMPPVYLLALKVNLVCITIVSAEIHSQKYAHAAQIANLTNLKVPCVQMTPVEGQNGLFEAEFDPAAWRGSLLLPNTITPTFKTCNIARTYALEIFADISHGLGGDADSIAVGFDIAVLSGIKAPESLVRAAANQRANPYAAAAAAELANSSSAPPPQYPTQKPGGPSIAPSATGSSSTTPAVGGGALPTYDEVMSSELQPLSGPRPAFQQNPNYYANANNLDSEK